MNGIIVYIVVAVVSAVLKKVLEDKAKRAKPVIAPAYPEGSRLSTVSLEDLIRGRLSQPMVLEAPEPLTVGEGGYELEGLAEEGDDETYSGSADYEEESEEWALRRSKKLAPESFSKSPNVCLKRLNLAQAVIMSELVGLPRAKRPWPNR